MLFDYQTLKVIWWVLVGAVLILYATTAGFDFGVTLLVPFLNRKASFAENDAERRVILNTVAPTWDGNQTWIVFAGGALFVIWPVVYATTFSGMYALILFILWSFFLRPPGFDYRSKLKSPTWRKMWDWGLFISAFFPVLMFGLIFGNLFHGLPISFNEVTMRTFYGGNFFGLITPLGIIGALLSLFMCLMHGAAHLNRRTDGDLQLYFRRLHFWFSLTFLVLLTIGGLMLWRVVNGYTLIHSPAHATAHPLNNIVTQHIGAWWHNYADAPWKWIGVFVAYAGVILAMITARGKQAWLAFWLSSLGIAGTLAMTGAALFPFIVPSSANAAESITVWNAASSPYTLMGMFYISLVMLVIIFAYKLLGYRAVWRKQRALGVKDIQSDSHTYY